MTSAVYYDYGVMYEYSLFFVSKSPDQTNIPQGSVWECIQTLSPLRVVLVLSNIKYSIARKEIHVWRECCYCCLYTMFFFWYKQGVR